MQLFSSISQSLDFWQTLSSCTASAARIREGEISVQGPWKSNRKGGHALPPDGSSGQSFPLFYHPPVLPFSRNVIQHGVLYFLCPRQLHNTSALLVEICSPGLGQGVEAPSFSEQFLGFMTTNARNWQNLTKLSKTKYFDCSEVVNCPPYEGCKRT